MSTAQLYRAVHLTARTSALLFAGAQATSALGPRAAPASRLLYLAFMTAHAVHFTVVARYASVNGGRNLFPGGRSLNEAGGWPTVAGIYTFFSSLAIAGWVAGAPQSTGENPMRSIGQTSRWIITAMFVGVYLGQVPRSRWYAVPAAVVAGAVTANVWAQRLRQTRPGTRTSADGRTDCLVRIGPGLRTGGSAGTLGELLASRRRRRFVGRASEMELFRAALDLPEPPFPVLHIHGPAGIGKTSLLDVFAELAADAGARVVRLDGRDLLPSPPAVLEALRRVLEVPDGEGAIVGPSDGGRVVVLIDTYERLAPLDDWVRTPAAAAPAGHRPDGGRRAHPAGSGLARRPGLARAVAGGVAPQPEPGGEPAVPARLRRGPGPPRPAGRARARPPARVVAAGRSWSLAAARRPPTR